MSGRGVAQTAPESSSAENAAPSGVGAKPRLWRAAISPTPPEVRTGPQNPAHVSEARATVLEWFSNKNVNVLPEEAVRKKLKSRLDLTTCPTDECVRTIASTLGLDFVIRVTVWENMPTRTSKFIEPTGVGVKLVFADANEPPVEYSATVTHMNVADTARTASVHAWQIYESRLIQGQASSSAAPEEAAPGPVATRASREAVVQSSMQASMQASMQPARSAPPTRSTLDLVGPIALGAAGAVALGFGIASFASSSCDTYSTLDPSQCLVGNDSNTGAGIALTALGAAAIGGGIAWFFLATPDKTPTAHAASPGSRTTSRVSLSPTHIGYHLQF